MNICKYLQISTSTYKHLQVSTSIYTYVQVSTNICHCGQVPATKEEAARIVKAFKDDPSGDDMVRRPSVNNILVIIRPAMTWHAAPPCHNYIGHNYIGHNYIGHPSGEDMVRRPSVDQRRRSRPARLARFASLASLAESLYA